MQNNIVHIASANSENRSFGTGFVIDRNERGVYILTCEHVLSSVQEPMVESQSVEVLAQSSFLDMAIIFVPTLSYEPVTLQLDRCNSLHIKSIAFSSFKKDLVQKSTIYATLFKDFIELHSKTDNSFYLMKKIKADEDYAFSRGNSGAPIICKETGNVIAMLNNKEGTNIAYAIGVSSSKRLLEKLRQDETMLLAHESFYKKMSSFKHEVTKSIETKQSIKNKAIYHLDELREEKADMISLVKEKAMKFKYFLLGILTVFALYGVYSFFSPKEPTKKEYYNVVNIPAHETLNVREGAGRGYKIIDELQANAKHLFLIGCKKNDEAKKWCEIKYADVRGWVHSYYIGKDSSLHNH